MQTNRLAGADQKRPRPHPLVIDLLIALGWMLLLGFPLYFLFMLFLDYEHFFCGAQENFSIEHTASEIIPYHRITQAKWRLWLKCGLR